MPTFCVLYGPGPAWRSGVSTAKQDLVPHARYMHRLMNAGKLLLAGPFPDTGGLAIVEAVTLEEARALVAADPAVTAGVMRAEVQPWTPIFERARGVSPFGSAVQQ